MILEAERTITASTAPVPLHTGGLDGYPQTLLVKNTSANGATLTANGVLFGEVSASSKDIALPAGASAAIMLAVGDTLTAKRSGASDATLSVVRWYGR
ncbi:MAG TPA: hypothetical protein VJT49_09285 [Amycolatopsis sp.]|uniref:hypothetical protein n=1 Tax=Amycolatopsis sp. TaxID=37632 RepID=UPI002B48F495|nr:hypothetical protein [Amycolatopsis sp.]HKS45294.1 hypothetical protein [Amycolatopsis sp.]